MQFGTRLLEYDSIPDAWLRFRIMARATVRNRGRGRAKVMGRGRPASTESEDPSDPTVVSDPSELGVQVKVETPIGKGVYYVQGTCYVQNTDMQQHLLCRGHRCRDGSRRRAELDWQRRSGLCSIQDHPGVLFWAWTRPLCHSGS